MSDPNVTRRRLHELVEDGDIFGAVKEAGQYHGFSGFKIVRKGDRTCNSIVPYGFMVKPAYALREDKWQPVWDTLRIGEMQKQSLEELLSKNKGTRPVEAIVEFSAGHERGHPYRPNEPVKIEGKKAPYSSSEITERQKMAGMDPRSQEAVAQRESQANLYSVVKYHEGERTAEDLADGISSFIWNHPIHTSERAFRLNRIVGAIADLVGMGKPLRRLQARTYANSYFPWLKPEVLDGILERAMEIDGSYRSNNKKKIGGGYTRTS